MPTSVERYSPNPGLWIDRTDKTIAISGIMEISGPEATLARATSVQTAINNTWTANFADGYTVSCRITVRYLTAGATSSGVTQIVAEKISGPSNVAGSPRLMTLNANETDAFTWTSAHEFGHILGLKDRYSEGVISKIRGRFGGTRTTTVQNGYNGNLMAQDNGALGGQNLKDLIAENSPSWMDDDDRVRDWVKVHSIQEIRALSITNKIAMIKAVMDGWISDEDVATIVRICSSVVEQVQAERIRKSINLSDFSGLGQRTKVRVAFMKMPQ